jgi:hypothetical protein
MIPWMTQAYQNETHMRPIVTCPPYENRGCGFHAKTAEPFSYKPPMTAVRSGIQYENTNDAFRNRPDA